MRVRVSILDLTAAIIVFVVLVLPDRSINVSHAYAPDDKLYAPYDKLERIALYQARLAVNPGDAMAAETLAELLIEVNQEDWAVQVAGEAARHGGDQAWRALLAVSMAHANRFEVHQAHEYVQRALAECKKVGADRCPGHESVRMSVFFEQLDAGVKSGIDPRIDPAGYQRATMSNMRVIRVRGATPDVPVPEAPVPETSPEVDEQAPGQNQPGAGAGE